MDKNIKPEIDVDLPQQVDPILFVMMMWYFRFQ